jgi:hypothetical protein
MPAQQLFEYAVVRIVPRVEREEFLNVGVVLYCSGAKFLQVKFNLDKQRLFAFSEKLDVNEVQEYLCAFDQICNGTEAGGPIAKLPIAERFRWLTATRSTIVQTSKVHPGLCDGPAEMLEKLYEQMVLV